MKKKTLQITNNDKKWLGLIAVIVGVILILLGSSFWGWLFSIIGIVYYILYIKKENIKEKKWIKKYKVLLILIVLVLFAGCINSSMKASDDFIKETQEIKKESKIQEPVIETPKTIEQTVISTLGQKTNMGEIKIKSIDDLAGDGSLISIHFIVDENLTPKMTRSGAIGDTMDVMKDLFQNYPKIERITIFAYFPVVDKYGNEDFGLGLKMMLNKETAQKINWKNMYSSNFKNVLDDYRELLRFE